MMNKNNIFRSLSFLAVAVALGSTVACSDEYEQELGPRPTGSFTVEPLAGKTNTYVLTSEVTDGFRYQWDVGEGFVEGAMRDTVYFPEEGKYAVKMRAMTRSGHALSTDTVVVPTTDPTACVIKLFGCDGSKTWVLDGVGSMWIGPVDESQTWWVLKEEDLAARACNMNDEFTFHEDGTFVYDNKGDFFVEVENDKPHPADIGLAMGCHPATSWPEKYSEWGSDTYTYQRADGKIKVMGTGAFLGMYKAGDAGNAAAPEESITYNIVQVKSNKLVVEKVYDWGKWRFTFKPKP